MEADLLLRSSVQHYIKRDYLHLLLYWCFERHVRSKFGNVNVKFRKHFHSDGSLKVLCECLLEKCG